MQQYPVPVKNFGKTAVITLPACWLLVPHPFYVKLLKSLAKML